MCKCLGLVQVRRSKYSLLLLNLRLRIKRSQVQTLTMQQTWDSGSRGHMFEPWSCNKPGTRGQEVAGLNPDHTATSPPPSCWHMHGNTQIIGVGTAQLVEHLAEKPGTILTGVRVPRVARDVLPLPESTSSADFYGVCPAPSVQSHASTSVHTLKIPNPGSHTTQQYHIHQQEWVVLLLPLLCPTWVMQPAFPTRDKDVLKNLNQNLQND